MWNLQTGTATIADVADVVGTIPGGASTCPDDVRRAARALASRWVGLRLVEDRVAWIEWTISGACARPGGAVEPWAPQEANLDAEPMPDASLAERYGELCSLAHYAAHRNGRLAIGVRHRAAEGRLVDPAKKPKVDKNALKRAKRLEAEALRRTEAERKKQEKIAAKYPKPKSRKGAAAIVASGRLMAKEDEQESRLRRISSTLERVEECEEDRGPGCDDAEDEARELARTVPAAKKAVRRAKAPSEADQRLIAQAHFLAMLRDRSPGLRLPTPDAPETTWQPDGPAQTAKYRKIWRDQFDAIFWPAAEAGVAGDRFAARVAEAVSPAMWEEYGKSNVMSMDLRIRKGAISIPQDPVFFPSEARRSNPRAKSSAKKRR